MNGNSIEEKLKEVTGIIFNNWFALKVALDHGQGGPPAVQNCKVESLVTNVTSMILSLSQNDDFSEVSDYLEDYMDDQFNIELEDDSQMHVTEEIYKCCKLLRTDSDAEVITILNNLPVKTSVLNYAVSNAKAKHSQNQVSHDSSDDVEEEEEMEEDPDWTVVKSKRK